MPLLDHFRPPLSQRRHWDSFHGAWAEAIALNLNQSLLPERFVAEARVKQGGQVQIDVGTFAEQANGPMPGPGGVAVWAPPKPTVTAPLDSQDPDGFEVEVICRQFPSGCNPISVFLLTWTQPTMQLVRLDGLILEKLLFIFLDAWSLPPLLFQIFPLTACAGLRFQRVLGFGPIPAFHQNA